MLVEPLPGVGFAQLRHTLSELLTGLLNARGTSGTALDVYNAYIRWANDAVFRLSAEVSAADIERLVLTRRSWLLQEMPDRGATAPVSNLVTTEFNDRTRVFEQAIAALDQEIERWQRPGVMVVADTSFYVTHPAKLEDADIAALLPIREEPVRVIVPILVIDELDGLKRSGNTTVRWRAGYTLAVLDRLLPSPTSPGTLRAEDFSAIDQGTGGIPRGQVTVEIMFDPPGHARLPIADDEIVARALAAENRRGRPVTMLTYDTGQAMRARTAGLAVKKLTEKLEVEPAAKTRG